MPCIVFGGSAEQSVPMTPRLLVNLRAICILSGSLFLGLLPGAAVGEAPPAAIAAFNSYTEVVETRLARQHRSDSAFLAGVAPAGQEEIPLRQGDLVVEQVTRSGGMALTGARLHHWRASAFAAGAKAEDFERLMKNFNGYPQVFYPQVVQAKVLGQQGERMQVSMRVRQHNVITVVMDTTYDVNFQRLDARRGYSISRSTRISEIESPGTSSERALNGREEHGFLWRLNTYWSYEERDGGLYLQVESVSLTRSIPYGLAWAVGPFVESVPRESLEFTLRSTCNALHKQLAQGANGDPKNMQLERTR
jgi:hypothetical protein